MNNFGFELPTEFRPPHRNAIVGETILFYLGGQPSELPVLATVTEVVESPPTRGDRVIWQLRCKTTEYGRRATDKDWTRHMGEAHWYEHPEDKRRLGAWDFHPVYRVQFDNWVKAAHMREARRRLREQEAVSTPAEEVEAIAALERHGPVLKRIAQDAGVSPEALKKMPLFWREFQAAKAVEFEEKNRTDKELVTV